MSATLPESRTMITPDRTVRISGVRVSSAWIDVYSARPQIGRWLRQDEERPDANVVVISTDTWRRYFAKTRTFSNGRFG